MKMNKSVIGFAAFLLVNILIASGASAEYGGTKGYVGPTNAVIRSSNNILRKLEQAVRDAKTPGEKAAAEAKLDIAKTEDILEQSKEERRLRKELGRVVDETLEIKGQQSLIEAMEVAKARNKEAETQKNLDLLASIGLPSGAVSGSGTTTGDLGPLCKNSVDFGQFKQVSNMINSEAFAYVRKEAGNFFDNERQKASQEALQKLAEMRDRAKKAAKNTGKDEFQKNIQNKDNFADLAEYLLPKRIDWLANKALPKAYANLEDASTAFEEYYFDKLIPNTTKQKQSESEIRTIATNTANMIQQLRDIAKNSGMEAATTLKSNCDNIVKAMSFENPLAPETYSNSLVQTVKAVFNPDGQNKTQPEATVAQRLQALSGQFRCTDAPTDIEALYGAPVDQALNILRGSKDARTLMAGIDTTLKAVANAQNSTDSKLSPLKEDCKKAEAQAQNIEKNVAALKEQGKQQQVASSGGLQPRTPGAGTQQRTGTQPVAGPLGAPGHSSLPRRR